jgi:hypothetical protein
MGHTILECGTGEFQDSQLQFGAWMVAEERFWRPGTPGVRARFPARFEGGGRGRGFDSGRGGGSSGRVQSEDGRGAGGSREEAT